MLKILHISLFLMILGLVPSVVYAQKGSGSGTGSGSTQGNGDQMKVQDVTIHDTGSSGAAQGNQIQNQNQVSTQNQGEDSKLNVSTQNNEGSQFGAQRNDIARQRMSRVAQAVENILTSDDLQGGIGKQVSDIAKQQKQAQRQIGDTLEDIESKKGLSKKLFGPNYGAIKEMRQLMEQNQIRIQQLQQLQNQTQNQTEQTQLQEMIQAMVEQNTSLKSQIQAEEDVNSFFGWLIKLFN